MTLVIGAILAVAIIAVAVGIFVRLLGGRSAPVVTPPPVAERVETAIDAAEILARMRTAYVSLESYQDTGLVIERVGSTTDIRHHTRGMFSTMYRKPHSLAFYFQPLVENDEREWHWLVMDGDRFESRASGAPTGHLSISATLADLTEKTLGATLCALPLLIHVTDLARLDDLQSPAYVGIGHVEGNACYKISGKRGTSSIVLWVDQSTLLIREVEFNDGQHIIIITPETGAAIPSDAFVTPPAGV